MQTVRVITDPRDATRDYRLPRDYAEREFDAGRLEQIDWNGWKYSDPSRRHIKARVNARGK